MMDFTNDEMNLMCIYNAGSRIGLIEALTSMQEYLESDEKDLKAMTESALEKLSRMSDEEFEKLELIPDFDLQVKFQILVASHQIPEFAFGFLSHSRSIY